MGQFATEVKRLIEQQFGGAEIDIEQTPEGRVVGSVIWDGFDSMDHAERQQEIRYYLRDQLKEKMNSVGVLLMYTPHELELMQAA